MPILIETVIWSQTNDQILIKIPLNGQQIKNIDIFLTEKYIKVNFSPYFYEAFLENAIHTKESTCKVMENCIKFTLKKVTQTWWNNLNSPKVTRNKLDILKLKEQIMSESAKNLEFESDHKKKNQADLKRNILEEEIRREQENRHKIEVFEKHINTIEMEMQKSRKEKIIIQQKTDAYQNVYSNDLKFDITAPPIRLNAVIDISFSVRRFITPQRESQEQAEREWLLKQNEFKQNIEFSDIDLSAEERNSEWLLEKGNDFLRKKIFLAAISAYTSGINIQDSSPMLLLNRAIAHFNLQNYNRCCSDSSQAYDLFVPAVLSNLCSRAKCLYLRGAALTKLGFRDQGESETKAARLLDPHNWNNFLNI